MRCKFVNDVNFITYLSLSTQRIYELFWDHIFIMFVFILYYSLFKKSKHMVTIPIRYYLCDSCLYFLISICTYVAIDINNLFINVIQVGECYILYNFIIQNYYSLCCYYYELALISKLSYLLMLIILHIINYCMSNIYNFGFSDERSVMG